MTSSNIIMHMSIDYMTSATEPELHILKFEGRMNIKNHKK